MPLCFSTNLQSSNREWGGGKFGLELVPLPLEVIPTRILYTKHDHYTEFSQYDFAFQDL